MVLLRAVELEIILNVLLVCGAMVQMSSTV